MFCFLLDNNFQTMQDNIQAQRTHYVIVMSARYTQIHKLIQFVLIINIISLSNRCFRFFNSAHKYDAKCSFT